MRKKSEAETGRGVEGHRRRDVIIKKTTKKIIRMSKKKKKNLKTTPQDGSATEATKTATVLRSRPGPAVLLSNRSPNHLSHPLPHPSVSRVKIVRNTYERNRLKVCLFHYIRCYVQTHTEEDREKKITKPTGP